MKKIFALVLAVAMLSSTALALPAVIGDVTVTGGVSTISVDGANLNPGSKLYVGGDKFVISNGSSSLKNSDIGAGEFCVANLAINKRTFKKGANLVKAVTIDDDKEAVCIEFNDDLNLTAPNAVNVVIDEISIKAKKALDGAAVGKNVPRNAIYNYSAAGRVNGFKIGYVISEEPLDASPEYVLDTVTKFTKGGDVSYAIASQSASDLYVEGRVYADDKIFVAINNDVEKEVLKAYPDADLRFVNLKTSGFTSNNVVNVLADEDEFVYEIVDKKVVKTNLKWDADAYAWAGKTIGSKNYVISDIELKVSDAPAAGETPSNPETGANDVVGVAAALAVVSLVAAGAVSLKK